MTTLAQAYADHLNYDALEEIRAFVGDIANRPGYEPSNMTDKEIRAFHALDKAIHDVLAMQTQQEK